MTAEERAAVVMDETKRAGHRYVDEGGMREAIAAAIRAAVDAERERCARIADGMSDLGPVDRPYSPSGALGIEEQTARRIAARIRGKW